MEDSSGFASEIAPFLKKNILLIVLFGISVSLIGVGVVQYLKPQKPQIEFSSATSSQVKGVTATGVKILVDVSGEVMRSGVYELSDGSRIQDALVAAGGLSENADREYISKRVNLAQKITDGAKLYFPSKNETPITTTANDSTDSFIDSAVSSGISINSASQSELESLPKIGSVTAQKIINGRPYSSVEELVTKKAITQKTLDAIKASITVY